LVSRPARDFNETIVDLFNMSAPAILIRSATETLPASNVATHEAAAAAAAAGTAIYYVPRRFDKDSKLHVYLAHKCPGIISLRKLDYNLYQVKHLSRGLDISCIS